MCYLSDLRSCWVEDPSPKREYLANHPLRSAHLLTETLAYGLLQKMGKLCPPARSSIEPLPFGQLCELALLRKDLDLALKLKPLLSFPTLWCQESQGSKGENLDAIELFRRSCGFEKARDIKDPYFQALEKDLPQFDGGQACHSWCSLSSANGITSAIVRSGENVPVGAMAMGDDLIIPAFGPQSYPLNNPEKMGIHLTCGDTFASLSADREVWMEMKDGNFRFVGLSSTNPIAFVFYVRARMAHVGNETFAPQSLRRYQGLSQRVIFEGQKGRFYLEGKPSKMELIPLSGGGGFWDADFLLAFEIATHDPHIAVHSGIL